MPRCLMAKKWKGYAWADRVPDDKPATEDDDEEIDVVGDTGAVAVAASCWGPSSPTAGATAPSPPPPGQVDARVAMLYNGYLQDFASFSSLNAYLASKSRSAEGSFDDSTYPHQPHRSYAVLQTPAESSSRYVFTEVPSWDAAMAPPLPPPPPPPPPPQPALLPPPPPRPLKKSLAMCFTSTGAALSLPPKKKDIYRPYSLDDSPQVKEEYVRSTAAEDLRAAHAILDLSAATHGVAAGKIEVVEPLERNDGQLSPTMVGSHDGKTVAYTYEAFFVSDGRSKRKSPLKSVGVVSPPSSPLSPVSSPCGSDSSRPRYTCPECGKQYATSSNLSRHKQTHRSLDSQSAKKCLTCGKAYVSMPALAMHLLTHKLSHACGVCGKLFSRPWLLQGHLRSHSGEKPFGCAHCGKAFADRSNLRAHMQTHSADKNYACARCHKSFALKSYLNKHLESACFKDGGCSGAPDASERASSCPPATASFPESPIVSY